MTYNHDLDNDNKYCQMAQDLIRELTITWGQVKFLDWWQANIVALNDRVWWDNRSIYIMLKAEHDQYDQMYNRIFGEELIRQREWAEQAIDERP